jgi:CheY-like chemotaxis protein
MTTGALPAILLVDDDEGHLMVARRAIERSDIDATLHVAHNGKEALDLLGIAGEDRPDDRAIPPRLVLVMLDLWMPGVGGWEVLKRLRESKMARQVPVVVVSASDRPGDVRRSYELGANSYLVKRFDPTRPGGYLADAVRYWIELNQTPGLETKPGSHGTA